MLVKLLLIVLLTLVIFNMAFALRNMIKGGDKPLSHYLGRRLLFTIATLVLLFIMLFFGLIEFNPHPY